MTLRLYGCAIVLAAWAALWAVDVRGNGVIVLGLSTTAVALVISERTRSALRRGRR